MRMTSARRRRSPSWRSYRLQILDVVVFWHAKTTDRYRIQQDRFAGEGTVQEDADIVKVVDVDRLYVDHARHPELGAFGYHAFDGCPFCGVGVVRFDRGGNQVD